MKIGIDVRRMYGQKTGVGVYTQNLIYYLAKIDNKNEYMSLLHKLNHCPYIVVTQLTKTQHIMFYAIIFHFVQQAHMLFFKGLFHSW